MLITHTQGATFSYSGYATLPSGVWDAEAAIGREDGSKVDDLQVTLTPLGSVGPSGETHALALYLGPAATAAWPVEKLVSRVWFTDADGERVPSPIFEVQVERG